MFEEVRKKEIHSLYRLYDELHFIFIRSLIFYAFIQPLESLTMKKATLHI